MVYTFYSDNDSSRLHPRLVNAFLVTSCLYYWTKNVPSKYWTSPGLFLSVFFINIFWGDFFFFDLYLVWPTCYFVSWFEQFCPLYPLLTPPFHLYPGLTNLFLCILVWLIYFPVSCSYLPTCSVNLYLISTNLYSIPLYPLPTNLPSSSVS